MKVLVMGGTGLVGRRLVQRLRERGDEVTVLTRRPEAARTWIAAGCAVLGGDPMEAGPWMAAVHDADAVINLVGEPVFGRRWNEAYKSLLRDSRVLSTKHAVDAMRAQPCRADGQSKTLVNASAIGYYGPRGDEILDESAAPGDDLLARLTVDWEAAARAGEEYGVRVSMVRIGVVLDRSGGALQKMSTPFRLGIGGPIGSGRQWVSWIHHRDVVGILLLALDRQATGPINGTAPDPVTNRDLSKALGRALHRPAVLPVPAFALRMRFGEVAGILTTGQRVVPQRALSLGYAFEFPHIDAALADVLNG